MTASKKVEYYTIDFYYNALEVVPKHHGDWVKAKDYESERTARLEAEKQIKTLEARLVRLGSNLNEQTMLHAASVYFSVQDRDAFVKQQLDLYYSELEQITGE